MAKKVTLKMTVEVEVDLDAYAETYGLAAAAALADAKGHVPALVQEGATEAVARPVNGSRVTRVGPANAWAVVEA